MLRFKTALQSKFKDYWSKLINNDLSKHGKGGNKLRTYRMFKQNFTQEAYLQLPDFCSRRALAQLRISAHKLRIESDRFNGKNYYIPPNQRICTNCSLDMTEDELHFLIKCPAFADQRTELFAVVAISNVHFTDYNDLHKFTWLMLAEDRRILSQVATFIITCMKLRN